MNPAPESIWKKRWGGPRWTILLCLVLVLVLGAAETAIFSIVLGRTHQPVPGVFMVLSVAFTVLVFLVLLFALVIPTYLRQRLFNRRMMGRHAFVLLCLITLIALFYAEEDWRGRHVWDGYLRAQRAKGAKVDWAALVPPPVPDNQNLAMCPLLKPILDYSQNQSRKTSDIVGQIVWHDTNGLSRVQRLYVRWNDSSTPGESAHFRAEEELDKHPLTNGWINLAAWQNYFRTGTNLDGIPPTNSPANDVLLALRPLGADLAELEQVAQHRPLARWPVHYDTEPPGAILLPHLGYCRNIVRTLQLRASARFATGDANGGLSDLRLGMRLADSVKDEPILISHLVRIVDYQDLLELLKEGLARREFSDGQLAELEKQFDCVDFLAGYRLAIRGTDAMNRQWSRLSTSDVDDLLSIGTESGKDDLTRIEILLLFRYGPSGWVYQNVLSAFQLSDQYLLPAIDARKRIVYPQRIAEYEKARNTTSGPFNLIPKVWLFQFLKDAPQKFALGQTEINQAALACGLERYRLAHHEYPPSLEALTPQFLKSIRHDAMNGQPLHYRRTEDGRYLIYSVGWNEKDDGGQVVLDQEGNPDLARGDWVWQLPR